MQDLTSSLPEILSAFWATVRLAAVGGILSLVFGTILTAMRVAPAPVLRAVGTAYVNIFRNTPLTLVLLFCSLGISNILQLNFSQEPSVNGYWLAILGLTAYTSTFVCEALRSGINTVPMGQAEAARAIGLTFMQTLRLVVLPQAFRTVIAPLGSVMIALTKNTTVVIVAGYAEAAFIMKSKIDDGFSPIPLFIVFALGFMVLTLPMGYFFTWLAKRMAVAR
jgi:glutamate transport system permease protein